MPELRYFLLENDPVMVELFTPYRDACLEKARLRKEVLDELGCDTAWSAGTRITGFSGLTKPLQPGWKQRKDGRVVPATKATKALLATLSLPETPLSIHAHVRALLFAGGAKDYLTSKGIAMNGYWTYEAEGQTYWGRVTFGLSKSMIALHVPDPALPIKTLVGYREIFHWQYDEMRAAAFKPEVIADCSDIKPGDLVALSTGDVFEMTVGCIWVGNYLSGAPHGKNSKGLEIFLSPGRLNEEIRNKTITVGREGVSLPIVPNIRTA